MSYIAKKIPVLFKFINEKTDDKINFLQYIENNETIIKNLIDFQNKIIYVQNKNYDFKIAINNNIKEFKVILHNDTINNILINLNPDYKNKISDIEILIEDSSSLNSDLMIKYKGKKACFEINYNDLKIGRVLILNSELNFQLYVMDKCYLKNIEIEEQNNIISNLLNQLKKDNIDISKYKINIEQFEKTSEKKIKSFIGKKREKEEKIIISTNKTENNGLKEIKFQVKESNIGNKMLICIYNYDINKTITLHNMTKINIIDFNIIKNSNYDKNELNSYLNTSSNTINNLINKIKQSSIYDLSNISIVFEESDKNICKYSNCDIDDKIYLMFLKDCFEDIYCSIMRINYNIIENVIKPQKEKFVDDPELTDFIKKTMINIFSYFDYFREYTKYLANEDNTISNLIIPSNQNLSNKEKINILSSIINIMFVSPFFNKNKKIEFYNINNDNRNIYYKAKELLFNIIDNLTPDSAFLKGIKKTTSRIMPDLNECNSFYYNSKNNNKVDIDNKIFILEYKQLSELKKEVKSNVPDLIVRFVDTKTLSKAQYDILSGNILINEAIFKNKDNNFLEHDDNNIFEENNNIIKGNIDFTNQKDKLKYDLCIFKSFWRLNHESLGHKPISKINNGMDTPKKTILSKTFTKTEDAGEIVEYYIIENRKNDFYTIKNYEYDCSRLLDSSLYIESTFDQFWNIYEELEFKNNDEEYKETEKIKLYNQIKLYFNEQRDIKCENEKLIKKTKKYHYFKKKFILSKE